MAKNSMNEDKKVTTKGTGAADDKKTAGQNVKDHNSGKAKETKPNLQEDQSPPGQKGPRDKGHNHQK